MTETLTHNETQVRQTGANTVTSPAPIIDNTLIFDIEVFAHDNLAVFKNLRKETVAIYHNDYNGCAELIDGVQLVGYNCKYYDCRVLPKMIAGWNPVQIKTLNDQIIGGDDKIGRGWRMDAYDCFQQIDVSRPSLKKIEANKGRMILESDVPFDIQRELDPDELNEVIYYCSNDVSETVDVYLERELSYFKAKNTLVGMVKNPPRTIGNWNTTTISANVLLDRPLTKWADIRLGDIEEDGSFRLMNLVPEEVQSLWHNKEKGNVDIDALGCKFKFGFGGLHGEAKNKNVFEDVTLWDVTLTRGNTLGPR